jgi:HK97 family phage major capsid protein
MSKLITLSDAERKAKEEKKNDLITRAEELVETAKTEERELTEDEAMEIAEIRDDVKAIKAALKLDDDMRELKEMDVKPDEEPKEEEVTMDENRACNKEEKRSVEELERAEFEAFLRGTGELETRANNMDVTNNGAVIPETIVDKIIKKVYDVCPILERSTKYNIKGTVTIPYYDENTTHITVDYQTEFVQIASNVGKFTSQVTLTGFLAGALAKVSRSLINNSQFNIVDHVIDLMAEHIARWIEGELLNGTSQKVAGLSALTNSITAASASAITADEIIKLHDKVKDRYQSNAIWIVSPATRTALRLLKDEMGRYLLQDDISSPFGSTLLGKPVYVSDNMPEIATGNTAIYYGDMKGLATKFNESISIEVLREKYADEHAYGIISWFEFDATVEDQQKIAKLVMA